jgi:hypothetical protein
MVNVLVTRALHYRYAWFFSFRRLRIFFFLVVVFLLICLFVCLFVYHLFRHTQQFFSYMMAVSFYWWKREPRYRYIIQCIWVGTTDLPQVNWQTFSHSHIGTSRIQTDAGWRWEVSWYETDVLTTQLRGPPIFFIVLFTSAIFFSVLCARVLVGFEPRKLQNKQKKIPTKDIFSWNFYLCCECKDLVMIMASSFTIYSKNKIYRKIIEISLYTRKLYLLVRKMSLYAERHLLNKKR